MSIDTSSTRAEHGFMLHEFPAPFTLDGIRWRSVSHWMRSNDGDVTDAVEAKFMQNPELAVKLVGTVPNQLPIPEVMRVRDTKSLPTITVSRDHDQAALTNLSNMVRDRGYILEHDFTETTIKGFETHMVGDPRSRLIVDVFLDEPYTEARLKEFIDANERLEPNRRPQYIIMGRMESEALGSIINRVATYSNIIYLPPDLMHTSSVRHKLTPMVRVIDEGSEAYEEINSLSLAEIDHQDVMVRQLALPRGTIIEVMDFSPHYRRVV